MADKRSIKERTQFRELAFQLQTATGDRADDIVTNMIDIMNAEEDGEEKENMRSTLFSNINFPPQQEEANCG